MNFQVSWIHYNLFNCRWDPSQIGDFTLALSKGEIKNSAPN